MFTRLSWAKLPNEANGIETFFQALAGAVKNTKALDAVASPSLMKAANVLPLGPPYTQKSNEVYWVNVRADGARKASVP